MAFSIRLNQVQYTTILGTYIICKQDTLPSYFLVHNLTYANQRMNYIILNRRNKSVSFFLFGRAALSGNIQEDINHLP